MSDEDYDDELPQISMNRTVRVSDFDMPSADVLASQRAREEECEEELRQLRSQYEKREVVRLISTDSESYCSSESEGSLTAAVDALNVAPAPDPPPSAASIVSLLATNLITYDTEFLTSYLEILKTNDEDVIYTATNDIAESLEHVLMDVLESGIPRSEEEVVVVCSWLCAAAVWGAPRVPAARRLLAAALAGATAHQAGRVADAVCAAVRDAGGLVRAANAARGPSGAQGLLADRLLGAALDLLAPGTESTGPDELCAQRVCARLCAAWRQLPAGARHVALQLAGRARWPERGGLAGEGAEGAGEGAEGAGEGAAGSDEGAAGSDEGRARAAVREFLALVAQPPPMQHRHSPEYLKVLVGASKLQILFRVNP